MSEFTEKDREMLIRVDERMSNHLTHHERTETLLNKWLLSLTILILGLIGRAILMWIL